MPLRRIGPICLGLALLLGLTGSARADDPLAKYDAQIRPAHRRHWAFQPVRPVVPPAVRDASWIRNPIDSFVLARLEARGWKPSPAAAAPALLRRVYLDLVGLPPTPEEQDAFARDTGPHALERVADRLLASPRHGERYARHWLDVARYADSNGYERDADKPGAWRFRDYIIRALNADRPFDRLVVEQLAGDELPDADSESIVGTGFLRLGPWDDEPADPKVDRYDQLDDMLGATSEAFLGLTLACARCHDHKFDPLTVHDYYRVVAVFQPLSRPVAGRNELDRPALPASRRTLFDRTTRHKALLDGASRAGLLGTSARAGLKFEADRLEAELAGVPRGYFMEETSPRAASTHILRRGRPESPGPAVSPGVPAVLTDAQPAFLASDESTTRRRLSLARWIAARDNPLTARVIVNRVWLWHFGEALVRTPNDFGTRGETPTHPELLDWLAGWFVENGWSLKALHRLIVTSNTYAMSKQRIPKYAEIDPENRLLWRFPYRRLEAEAIRDSLLYASGQLDERQFGPGVRPRIPRAALEGHSDPLTIWRADPDSQTSRRTIYVHLKRSLMVPLLEALDLCDTTRSSGRRMTTTVAPQALMLFNGEFALEQATFLAARLRREAKTLDAQLDLAWRLLVCRPIRADELAAVRRFHDGQEPEEALARTCRVLLNLNEFVYPD